jgi:hypothetical protein
MADLLRNPIYNGFLVRFRGFADEERAEAPWRSGPDGDPPVSDDLWERVQAIRSERATVGARPTPHLTNHIDAANRAHLDARSKSEARRPLT